jgi:hypothetical protein
MYRYGDPFMDLEAGRWNRVYEDPIYEAQYRDASKACASMAKSALVTSASLFGAVYAGFAANGCGKDFPGFAHLDFFVRNGLGIKEERSFYVVTSIALSCLAVCSFVNTISAARAIFR